jgi:SAM-dependent methyltransferase
MDNEEASPIARYYAKCAASIERGYAAPERQGELGMLREQIQQLLRGHVVLELGCGTGYWTDVIARTADTVQATDIAAGLIGVARERALPGHVIWAVADALNLPPDLGEFSAVFVGFLWSHLKRDEQERLLEQLRARVGKDALLVLLDDAADAGESVARTDAEGNTYQILTAPDGERIEVPKSYPSDSTLRKRLGAAVREIKINRHEHYWLLTCRLR